MQFHLNGFQAGNPDVSEILDNARTGKESLPEQVDVLIVGSGPAGLTLAAQLAVFPDISVCLVEQKPGPMQLGQADGIACRTMEMFQAFGFAERVLREAYWVNETSFWRPSDAHNNHIMRSGRVQDVEDGLSEFPHVILNQARVHDFFLDVMRQSPNRLQPDYCRRLVDLQIDTDAAEGGHPVTATLERTNDAHSGQTETIRARYVIGCDGARSTVRQSLGRALKGDSANLAWGVMDVLAVTDFPDIRLKGVIQSANEGNIVLIPREGGYLVRIYVELDKLSENERIAGKSIGVDQLIAATQRILRPYSFEAKEVAWWSVYEIGQRLTDRFDDLPDGDAPERNPRVFIAGDACHTHSPKAGQGMNVSMQDAFNLGWKLVAVLRGICAPDLLRTYSNERQAIARDLIDFDREWAKLLSAPTRSAENPDGVDPAEVQKAFVLNGRYTAGTVTRYTPSILTGRSEHQHLAKGFEIGTRFHSAPVIRLADAKPMQLGHTVTADARWRLFAFETDSDLQMPDAPIRTLCGFLGNDANSPILRHTSDSANIDSVIDLRAIFQQGHRDLDLRAMPDLLQPLKGRLGLRDYEKIFCPDLKSGPDIFDLRGIDRKRGCLVIVRPDQYIANVLPLNAHDQLAAFFAGFMRNRR